MHLVPEIPVEKQDQRDRHTLERRAEVVRHLHQANIGFERGADQLRVPSGLERGGEPVDHARQPASHEGQAEPQRGVLVELAGVGELAPERGVSACRLDRGPDLRADSEGLGCAADQQGHHQHQRAVEQPHPHPRVVGPDPAPLARLHVPPDLEPLAGRNRKPAETVDRGEELHNKDMSEMTML